MEHCNVLVNCLIIFALIFIATPSEASDKILHHDGEVPAYPWQRLVYRERVNRLQKRNNSDSNGKNMGDFWKATILIPEKKMYIFDGNKGELKQIDNDPRVRVIYGNVPEPTILMSYL